MMQKRNQNQNENYFYFAAKVALVSVPAVCFCFAPGCGQQQGTSVHETVTLDGAPVEKGNINFFPLPGTKGPVVGAPIATGEYKISAPKGPPVGSHRVTISSTAKTGKKVPAGSPYPPGAMVDEHAEVIPARYNTDSTLEREVTDGENTLDFDLTSSDSE